MSNKKGRVTKRDLKQLTYEVLFLTFGRCPELY